MPARPKTKLAPVPASPIDPLFAEALKRIGARTEPLDLRPNDMVSWTLSHFRIPREEQEDMRLKIAPYQVKGLTHAFSRDAKGLFNYDVILWGDIKKSIKSTLSAAATLWRAWHVDYGQFYIVANTREQADSRVFYYLRRAIELNPNLKAVCQVNPSMHTIDLPNHSRIEAIAVNAAGEAGGNPTMVSVTEAWGATSKDAMRLWTETTLPPALFGKSQRFLDTYAGYEGESELLWQLYDTGVLQGEKFDPEYDFFYRNKAARMFSIWNTKPRLSWQTPEYYSAQQQILSPQEFSRVHLNQWASASEAFVPKEWWDSCVGEIPPYNREPCVMAVDGALTDDTFSIVVLDKVKEFTRVRYAKCWVPPLHGQIDFEGTPENPGPEMEIVRLCKEMVIAEVAYDKTHVADMLARLQRKHGIHIYDFSQGQLRLVADKALRDNIRDRNIVHSNERDLTVHIVNANAKIPPEGREYLRIVKRSNSLKCDLAVCLSMANHELRFAFNIT
jgi:phage terminase large subunit-like protein